MSHRELPELRQDLILILVLHLPFLHLCLILILPLETESRGVGTVSEAWTSLLTELGRIDLGRTGDACDSEAQKSQMRMKNVWSRIMLAMAISSFN